MHGEVNHQSTTCSSTTGRGWTPSCDDDAVNVTHRLVAECAGGVNLGLAVVDVEDAIGRVACLAVVGHHRAHLTDRHGAERHRHHYSVSQRLPHTALP